jgi:hypothetical protein
MYQAQGPYVVYIHDVEMTEELFLTVHPTKDCTKTPEEQAESIARLFNDMDDKVKKAFANLERFS